MILELIRFAQTPFGTFGKLLINGAVLYTVERPWLDNKPSISCIPIQDYTCEPRHFFRGGYDTFEIIDVMGRSHILFHRGNTMNDVEGCIALGTKLGCIHGVWAVLNSKVAFEYFMDNLKNVDRFNLRIRSL